LFLHTHPYPPFIPENATKLIVGTLPPPRFTTNQLKPGDVDFCYGSRDGQLWPILDKIFSLELQYENTQFAVKQRQEFLHEKGIGICDIVASSKRSKIDASDLGMQDVKLRDLINILEAHSSINTLLFTGGNSKNGPEYFFRRLIKPFGIILETLSDKVPRKYQFTHPVTQKKITTVSLIAPSGAANRAVGSLKSYKELKATNPSFNTIDFRVLQYQNYF